MKKITVAILVLTMVLSSFAMAAAAETVRVPADLQVSQGAAYADKITIEAGDNVAIKATIDMQPVRDAFENGYNQLVDSITVDGTPDASVLEKFRACKVTGSWTLTLTYPSATVLPESVLSGTDMDGFSDSASLVFGEVSRVESPSGSSKVLTIQIQLSGKEDSAGNRPGYCTVGELKDNLDTWFANMEFVMEGVQVSETANSSFTATLRGVTEIKSTSLSETFNFVGIPKNTIKNAIKADVLIEGIEEGVDRVGGSTSGNRNNLLIGQRNPSSDDGEESGEGTGTGAGTGAGSVSGLNTQTHFAYVEGYPDGTIRPNDGISRAEAATILYRLLDPSLREEIYTDSYNFADLSKDLWYNKAVSSMARGGYVNGYEDGNFYGDKNITRAELVAMVARFTDARSADVNFTDVDASYWGYAAISTAVANRWVSGYQDGSFCPEQDITRAEAITIINRVLSRGVEESGLIDGIKSWSDNTAGEWYYYEILEAGNSHAYTGIRPNEKWSGLGITYYYDIDRFERP